MSKSTKKKLNESYDPWNAPVSDWQLFHNKIEIGESGIRVVGFNDPKGDSYFLGEGEDLVVIPSYGDSEPEVFIRMPDKTMIPFKKWKNTYETRDNLEATLDRHRLSKITKACRKVGTLFGDEIDKTSRYPIYKLTEEDRIAIRVALDIAKVRLEEFKSHNKKGWDKLQKVIKELSGKGLLMELWNFPPKWLVKNDSVSDVQTIMDGSGGNRRVHVSRELYSLYYWDQLINDIQGNIDRNNEKMNGTSAKYLGDNLAKLSKFFKSEK